jgi:hypothetical protein
MQVSLDIAEIIQTSNDYFLLGDLRAKSYQAAG